MYQRHFLFVNVVEPLCDVVIDIHCHKICVSGVMIRWTHLVPSGTDQACRVENNIIIIITPTISNTP